jgi:hypothetical protein
VDKHAFTQLLEQQRAGIRQAVEVVIYSVVLGVTANQIYDSLFVNREVDCYFWLALGLSAVFLFPVVYRIVQAIRRRIPVSSLSFGALLLFDQKTRDREPVQMPNYGFSIWANNDWGEILANQELDLTPLLEDEFQQTSSSINQLLSVQHQVSVEYLEYAILREFCGQVWVPDVTERHGIVRWLEVIAAPLRWISGRIRQLLHYSPRWRQRFQRRKAEAEVASLVGDHPITSLPESLQSNMWIQTKHRTQIGYEEHLRAGGDLMLWGFDTFTLLFPFKTQIDHGVTSGERLTIFSTKYGELSFQIRGTGSRPPGLLGDSFYYAPHLLPQEHPYVECSFEIVVSFAITQFHALKPWLSDEFDTYYNWAQDRMQAIENKFSWDKYSNSMTRDEFRRLERLLREHNAQVQIEMLRNFPDTIEGDVAKCIRWTRSFLWRHRRDGLEGLIELANQVPEEQVEGIILRLLRMSEIDYEEDIVTPWKTIEALGVYGPRSTPSLAHRVNERLWQIAREHPKDKRQGVFWADLGKALLQLLGTLSPKKQAESFCRIVDVFQLDSISFEARICEGLWISSDPETRVMIESFIKRLIQAEHIEERRKGVACSYSLRKELPPEVLKEVIADLLSSNPRDAELRVGIQRLICALNSGLSSEELECIIRYVLKETRSTHSEVCAAAIDTLRFQSTLYCKSSRRTINTIIRRLITLANGDLDEISARAAQALEGYASQIPSKYQPDVVSIFLEKLSACHQDRDANWLVVHYSMGLEALMEITLDEDLKSKIRETLSTLPY